VFPTYNEAENLPSLAAAVRAAMAAGTSGSQSSDRRLGPRRPTLLEVLLDLRAPAAYPA